MKRKELDRRLTQLLDRIDGELAEIRDGLIEIDHRAARTARDVDDYGRVTLDASRRAMSEIALLKSAHAGRAVVVDEIAERLTSLERLYP